MCEFYRKPSNHNAAHHSGESCADGLDTEFAEEFFVVVFHRIGCTEQAGGYILVLFSALFNPKN